MSNSNNSTKQSLSNFLYITAFITLVVVMWGGMFFIVTHIPQSPVKYDCSIAEISPDVPIEVKVQCRKLRMIKE